MDMAQQAELEQPAADLCRPDQRADRHRRGERGATGLQQARQVRRHRRAHEPGHGEDEGEDQRGTPASRALGLGLG